MLVEAPGRGADSLIRDRSSLQRTLTRYPAPARLGRVGSSGGSGHRSLGGEAGISLRACVLGRGLDDERAGEGGAVTRVL